MAADELNIVLDCPNLEVTLDDPTDDLIIEGSGSANGVPSGGTTGQVLAKASGSDYDTEWIDQSGGGTSDYTDLTNKPSINSITLSGNKTASDLGLSTASDITDLRRDLSLKVDDVQIYGTSIVTDGVANVPVANSTGLGVIKLGDGFSTDNTTLKTNVDFASSDNIKAGASQKKAINPYTQHRATFYGLAKAAGDSTQSASSNAVGTYTDNAKEKIHSMLNIADASAFGIVCNGETASQNIIKGQYVIWNGKLYIALVDISSGTTLSVGNLVAVNDGFFNAIALPKVYACYTAEEDMQAITLDFGSSYSFDVYDELVIVVYQSDTSQTNFCNSNWSYVYIKNNNSYAITQTSSLYFIGNQPNMIRLKRTPTGIFGNVINTLYSIKPIFVPKSADDELLVSNILFNRSSSDSLLTGTRIEAFLGRM